MGERPITEPVKEWQATYSLDRHIAEARERMGESRWAELEKEWNAAIRKGDNV